MRGGGRTLDDRNEAVQWQRRITKPEAYLFAIATTHHLRFRPPGIPATLRPCRADLRVRRCLDAGWLRLPRRRPARPKPTIDQQAGTPRHLIPPFPNN